MSAKSDAPDIEKLVGQLNANYATWIATQLKTNPTADCKKRIALLCMDRFDYNLQIDVTNLLRSLCLLLSLSLHCFFVCTHLNRFLNWLQSIRGSPSTPHQYNTTGSVAALEYSCHVENIKSAFKQEHPDFISDKEHIKRMDTISETKTSKKKSPTKKKTTKARRK